MSDSDFEGRLRKFQKAADSGFNACAMGLVVRLVADFPRYGRAWFEYGRIHSIAGRYKEARVGLQRALKLFLPEYRQVVQAQLGHLHRQKGEYRRAEEWYRKAVISAPGEAKYRVYLGALLAISGRLEEAESIHREAIQCAECGSDEAYLNLGFVLRALGRYAEASACFQKVIESSSGHEIALREVEDIEKALENGWIGESTEIYAPVGSSA